MNTSCFITVGNVHVTLFKIFGLGLFILFCLGCVLPEYKCVLYLCAWCPQRQVHVICHGTKITHDCVLLLGTGTAAGVFARTTMFLASWPSLQPLKLFLILVI